MKGPRDIMGEKPEKEEGRSCARGDPHNDWNYASNPMNKQYASSGADNEASADTVLMDALAECYRVANGWEVRRPILSIMADRLTLARIRKWIPNLSQWCYTEAKRHCLLYGRGQPVQSLSPERRTVVSSDKVEHFVGFITSPLVIQDLPFDEKVIKL